MVKKLEKRSKKTLKPPTSKMALPKTPSKSSISKILRKMGPRGKAAAAILAGVGIGVGGSALLNKKSKAKKVAAKPAAKSARKAGPSGPRMTSMKAPSTGPKPRNKDPKVNLKKRGPSRPSMTGFKKGGRIDGCAIKGHTKAKRAR